MVTTEEIIERTLYASLLRVAILGKHTINPEDFFPITPDNQQKFLEAKDKIKQESGPFVQIFGVGNAQSRGMKIVPRITIELNGYYPGDVGTEAFMIGKPEDNEGFELYNYPFTTKSAQYDIHLVAGNAKDLRILHQIMYTALPGKGYVRPFYEDTIAEYIANNKTLLEGNLFLSIGNFYDHNDNDHGILEKVYTYNVQDALLEETIDPEHKVVPIKDISVLIQPDGSTDKVNLHVPEGS